MNAKIKSLHLVDKWTSLDVDKEFYSNVEIEIGPANSNTSDLFNTTVCNYVWLINNIPQDGVFFLNKIIVSNNFDETFLTNIFSKKIASIYADDWGKLSKKLSNFLNWEYDDYIP